MKNGIQRQLNCFDGMDRVGLFNTYIVVFIISCFCTCYESCLRMRFLAVNGGCSKNGCQVAMPSVQA